MTTVGFGDFYPSSLMGRIIGLISSLIGVFLMSMLVVTLTNLLDLGQHERNLFMITEKVHLDFEKQKISYSMLRKYMKLASNYKKEEKKGILANKNALRNQKYDFLYDYYLFQVNKTKIESTYPPYSIFDAINENLNLLEEEFQALETRQSETGALLDKISGKMKL
eukprot:CAMPEP_0170538112 /NCGR_PEP_ID=MMETSP0209-20121228/103117_1 /TAXON_ID=665100 ORGANISM="Litonotus pictus, Strain P1" /NCGR_SAMPLE_ID=MMETSP0209 /ASSEMBLY_ACC=CAM_ASM_000301 /LENGTH=165 /DNA_ID=CAMNT_0010839741 /DNA_START=1132 /DNA_END=1632 /DNA_ORIENTATION=-